MKAKLVLVGLVLLASACGAEKGDPGERGDAGRDGVGTAGPRGLPGTDGADGKDGASIIGPAGPAGRDGKDGADAAPAVNGTNGRNAPGFVWVDQTGTPMPFFQVSNPTMQVGGISGMVVDPNTQLIWAFSYTTSGFSATPAQPNGITSPLANTQYFTSNDCTGTAYYPWSFNKGVTVSAASSPTTIYAAQVAPATIVSYSYRTPQACYTTRTTQYTFYVPISNLSAVAQQNSPKYIGVAPYTLTWQE